jgi:hypothetical protein
MEKENNFIYITIVAIIAITAIIILIMGANNTHFLNSNDLTGKATVPKYDFKVTNNGDIIGAHIVSCKCTTCTIVEIQGVGSGCVSEPGCTDAQCKVKSVKQNGEIIQLD